MDTEETSSAAFGRARKFWWISGFALCVAFAFSHSFSNMAKYDDESYVMMTIKTFLDGDRLYEETFTQYGPAYYMIQQPIHGWTGLPITHDIVRLKTIFCWMLLGILSGYVVARMTDKSLAGLLAMLLSVLYLQKLGLEPSHPQEVVAVLAMLCVALMGFQNRSILLLVGICAAVAGLIKLNVGASIAAACLFAAGFSRVGSKRFDRWMACATAFAAVAVSSAVFVSIAKANLESGQYETLAWPAIILFSTVLICLIAWLQKTGATPDAQHTETSWIQNPVLVIALGGVSGVLAVFVWAIVHGNSLQEILHGVLFQHAFMADSFYHPVNVSVGAMPFVLFAAVLIPLRLFRMCSGNETSAIDRLLLFIPPIVLAISIVQIGFDCCEPLVHGLKPRGAAGFLVTVGPVLMPLLLLKSVSKFRMTLAMTACLSPIIAYPVPGTQVNLGTLPIVLGLIVASFDACELKYMPRRIPQILCRNAAVISAILLVLATAVFSARWIQNKSLDQPGCRWVRIDPERAKHNIAVAECIRGAESEWLAFDTHNHNRFFFWTGKKPLTSVNPTFWPPMLTAKQMEQIQMAVGNADPICVVRLNDPSIKLQDYSPTLQTDFSIGWQPIAKIGKWQIGLSEK